MRKLHILKSMFGKSIDRQLVEDFEKKMGFKFPKRYKNFIVQYDNKRLFENCFKFINYYNKEDVRDVCFKTYDSENQECIYYSQINHYPDASPYFVQFATCANGDDICFDYRKDPTSSEPAVVVVFHDDVFIDENGEQKMVVNHVANSFGEFVELFFQNRDPEFSIEIIEIEV